MLFKGFDYEHSNLQLASLHKLQHKYDNFGRLNKRVKIQSTKEFLIIKQGNIRENNYICSCALLFDNVQSFNKWRNKEK